MTPGTGRGEDHAMKFWKGIESLFFTMDNNKIDPVTQEIQKLLSYRNESGWAVLSKGSAVVTAGHVSAMLTVISEFEKWKKNIKEKSFESAFKEHYTATFKNGHKYCCRLDVRKVAGKTPESMNCPECTCLMETYISYKCCHGSQEH